MSAAEQAAPEPYATLNTAGPAPVIDLNKHRHRAGAIRAVQGRRGQTMTTPDGSQADGEQSALTEWAETIEVAFIAARMSLTNPDTAAAYLRTLDVLERALQGSHANNVISAEQLAKLATVIDGMRKAPDLL
jgi:aspartokinase